MRIESFLSFGSPLRFDIVSDLLTKAETASLIGVSAATVTRLVNSNEIETERIGKREVIRRQTIENYLYRNNLTQAPVDHPRRDNHQPSPLALSFFSGAGGLDLGLERAGIECVFFCENQREARMTLAKNWPAAGLAGDIMDLTAEQVRETAQIGDADIDIIAGGPPCQAFSTAGARRAFDDPRGNVFLKYLDLCEELRPRYIVIENVRGLLSTPFPLEPSGSAVKGGALKLILKKIRAAGYSVSFNLYNAANFGSAQVRERVVIIAKREGEPVGWLEPTHSDIPEWQERGLKPWRTFRDVSDELRGTTHNFVQFPEKRLQFFKKLREGEYWTSLPSEDQREAMGKAFDLSGGRTGFYRRIRFDKPSPTLVTSPTMPATDLCHPSELRPLSVEEYKAIQGFPSDYFLAGNLTDIYRQIGNAVPVELGEAIGLRILRDMRGDAVDSDYSSFPFSRYRETSQLAWKEPKI